MIRGLNMQNGIPSKLTVFAVNNDETLTKFPISNVSILYIFLKMC